MILTKKVTAALAVLILAFCAAGCGSVKEKTDEGLQEKTSAPETSVAEASTVEPVDEKVRDGKTFHAEDLITMEEMSAITGVSIVDTKLWDNDYMGLLGATYLVEKGGSDGFTLNCYQQPYCGASNDDVQHPVLGSSVKEEYERGKEIVEKAGGLEIIEGLGQEAYYNNGRDVLHVLYNDDYYLEIRDNYLDDPAAHKETALKIAEKAIERLSEKL